MIDSFDQKDVPIDVSPIDSSYTNLVKLVQMFYFFFIFRSSFFFLVMLFLLSYITYMMCVCVCIKNGLCMSKRGAFVQKYYNKMNRAAPDKSICYLNRNILYIQNNLLIYP